MTKKLISLILALSLIAGVALAQSVPQAATMPDLTPLKRYAAWTQNGAEWSVYSNESAAALSQLSTEANAMGGAGYFYLALTGDESLSLIQPVLIFCYAGRAIGAESVSLAIDGTRYDLAVSRETATVGRSTIELLRAPLDEAGLTMLRELAAAESVTVRLTGSDSYTFSPKLSDTYPSTRQQLEASSLKGVSAMLNELDALDMDAYALWDINAARWQSQYGFAPRIETCALGLEHGDSVALENALELLGRGDQGANVRALQELLIATGYLQTRADASYGEGTQRAVLAAQQYYGLMPNGCADYRLIDCLNGAALPEAAAQETPGALEPLGDVCELTLDRFWFADAFASEKGAMRAATNADNTLLIAEGRISNTSAAELTFYWQMAGTLSRGEYSYPCTIVCEADGGNRFDSSMLPLAESRLFVYAEIPERIAGQGEWILTLTAGEASRSYNMTGGQKP